MNNRTQKTIHTIEKLYNERKSRKLWNVIRKTKQVNNSQEAVSMSSMVKHFETKFSDQGVITETVKQAEYEVRTKYDSIMNDYQNQKSQNLIVSEAKVRKYIRQLKGNTAAGYDGVTAEHLKFATASKLPLHISALFTQCVRFGIIPEQFNNGLVKPLLKKPTLDPTDPGSYRPITVSVVISKLFEMYIMDESNMNFSRAQFGFVQGRNTNMAIALAQDIGTFCVNNGTPVYFCSLDVEGAYDALPHSVILKKVMNAVPDYIWMLLFEWYSNMNISIRWGASLSGKIQVKCGTKQGGLTSCSLFNLFYYDLVESIQSSHLGVTIGNNHFNCICYADDLLLCSTTVTGLQSLMNVANSYVKDCGLRFNANKTSCFIMGSNPFTTVPKWSIDNVSIKLQDNLNYLGAKLSKQGGAAHCDERAHKAINAFYALQGAGVKYPGIRAPIALELYCSAVRSVLEYGNSATCVNRTNMIKLDKMQNKFVRQCVGLHKYCHVSPLLKATGILPMSESIVVQTLDLLKMCMLNESVARDLYSEIIFNKFNKNTLINRASQLAVKNDVDLIRYIFNNNYYCRIKHTMKGHVRPGTNGLVDTIRYLLNTSDSQNNKMLNLLLKSF